MPNSASDGIINCVGKMYQKCKKKKKTQNNSKIFLEVSNFPLVTSCFMKSHNKGIGTNRDDSPVEWVGLDLLKPLLFKMENIKGGCSTIKYATHGPYSSHSKAIIFSYGPLQMKSQIITINRKLVWCPNGTKKEVTVLFVMLKGRSHDFKGVGF